MLFGSRKKKMNVPGGPAFLNAFADRVIAINEQAYKRTAEALKAQLVHFAQIAERENFTWSIHVCAHPECFVWAAYNAEDDIRILGEPQQFCWKCESCVCDKHWVRCAHCPPDEGYFACTVCGQCQHCANFSGTI